MLRNTNYASLHLVDISWHNIMEGYLYASPRTGGGNMKQLLVTINIKHGTKFLGWSSKNVDQNISSTDCLDKSFANRGARVKFSLAKATVIGQSAKSAKNWWRHAPDMVRRLGEHEHTYLDPSLFPPHTRPSPSPHARTHEHIFSHPSVVSIVKRTWTIPAARKNLLHRVPQNLPGPPTSKINASTYRFPACHS